MKKLFLASVLLLISHVVMAHAYLESSLPKNNAMLMGSPESIDLNFSKPVRLVKLLVKNQQGDTIDIGFNPIKKPAVVFNWSLSDALDAGTYRVDWITMGADGHKMKGDFGFMVHALDNMSHDGMKMGTDKNNMDHANDMHK
jgi:methionine-rich copper-binding protein CopC